MPFTLSHPAAVLPLRRFQLSLSALVVGSLAPDFDYFLRLAQQDRSWHKFPGVLTLTFPTALAALFVFHAVMKWPVISLMPRTWQARVVGPARQFQWGPVKTFLLVLASLAIGIGTHIVWDGVTHSDGWLVTRCTSLSKPLFSVMNTSISAYKLAQHSSTMFGALAIAAYVVRWYRRAPQATEGLPVQLSPTVKVGLVSSFLTIAVSAGVWRGTESLPAAGLPALQHMVSRFAVTTTSIGLVEVFSFCLVWRVLHWNGAQ